MEECFPDRSETAWTAADDDALVEQARRSPAAARQVFVILYRRHVRSVYYYLYARTGCQADAEDLTEQVFSEALQGLVHYHPQGQFTAWLFTIARRRAVDHFRRSRPHLPLDQVVELADPHAGDLLDGVIHREDRARLAGLLDRLEESEKELLRLRFAGGLNFSEIADVFKKKESAVKMSYYRLLARLEDQLEVSHE